MRPLIGVRPLTNLITMVQVPLVAKWCYHLAVSGGDIIRHVADSGRLNVVNKADLKVDFDPTTDADRRAQSWIVGNLRHHFPDIAIIGEEEQHDYASETTFLPESVDKDPYFVASEWDSNLVEVQPDDIRIFVDPVDGTKDLTKGVSDTVTTLIGVAVAGKPVYGVVHYPFSGKTFHAAVGHSKHKNVVKSKPKRAEDNIVVTTKSHFDDYLKSYFEKLEPHPHNIERVGGCGHKAILVLEGAADAYVYPRAGTKKWDTCAPHAIIRAFNGHFVDRYGKELMYDANSPIGNDFGMICTLAVDPSLYILKSNEPSATSISH